MKKLIGVAVGGVVLLAAALAVVGYRHGWFSRPGLRSSGASGVVAGGAGEQASPAAGGPAANQAGQSVAPQFDGNVAALEWGDPQAVEDIGALPLEAK